MYFIAYCYLRNYNKTLYKLSNYILIGSLHNILVYTLIIEKLTNAPNPPLISG